MFVITGATGFIGSVLAQVLEETYDVPIVAVDTFGKGDKWKNLAKRNIAEVVAPEALMPFLQKNGHNVHAVLHMGAISSTTETDVDKLMADNVQYTKDLIHWSLETGKRIIYASSASTYGNGEHGYDDREDMAYLNKLQPMNPYGFSKHMIDKYIIQMPKRPQGWVGLKFFNVYGPNEYHKGRQASVIKGAYEQISETGKMRLFRSHRDGIADGEQMRDFVYVKDIARVVVWLLDNPQVAGLFNLGTGQACTFKDLTVAVFKAMGKRTNIEYIDMPVDIRNHYQYFTEANMDKLLGTMHNLGAKPFTFTSLEDGVADYVKNHLMAEDPYL
ncbi:MAG: ADP-glyceromanno-heptose 6-epimerase [Proteobacteria bacterium]|nr:ADP-glyceromanno-heptose 6-epimerase [Pseudomonadota bacterium]